ncbi:hypothetical protein [Mycobacterium sp. E3339]|uniref:hypothetical protein n=1 Tax=Mycobacterium sp. E3339 TaxID=1834146 RepID=UPI0012E88F92|nr:hypothetical protein [Mycobacterium sp. E3339]
MMSAGTVASAWSPHHVGQDHEDTDIDEYSENDQYQQRDPGDHRHALEPPRPNRIGGSGALVPGRIPGGSHD